MQNKMYTTYQFPKSQIEIGYKYFIKVSKYAVVGTLVAIKNGNFVLENGLEFTLREAWKNYDSAPKKPFYKKEIPIELARPLLKF